MTTATIEEINIALPLEMITTIKSVVDNGEYSNASEVVRETLRTWKFRKKLEIMELEEMRALVQEGMKSGPDINAETLFARLHAKYDNEKSEDTVL